MRLLGEIAVIQIVFGPLAAIGWFAVDVAFAVVLIAVARLGARD